MRQLASLAIVLPCFVCFAPPALTTPFILNGSPDLGPDSGSSLLLLESRWSASGRGGGRDSSTSRLRILNCPTCGTGRLRWRFLGED